MRSTESEENDNEQYLAVARLTLSHKSNAVNGVCLRLCNRKRKQFFTIMGRSGRKQRVSIPQPNGPLQKVAPRSQKEEP